MGTPSVDGAILQDYGKYGVEYISTGGTATYNTSTVAKITALTDSIISATAVVGNDLTSVTLKANGVIYGEFSSVTCAGASGELLLNLARE